MEGRTRFRCSECNYETIKKIHLKVHIDLVHKKIKHQCPECGKELYDKSGLNRHKKFVHDGIKYDGIKYHCDFCEYKSGTKQSVKVHTSNVHGITRTIV